MSKQAWEIEKEMRDAAVPVDRRTTASDWYTSDMEIPYGDVLIKKFWFSQVPGSRAPEIPYLEWAQAQYTRGYDTSAAVPLILEGIELARQEKMDELRVLTSRILNLVQNAPINPKHPIHCCEHPSDWDGVRKAMALDVSEKLLKPLQEELDELIYQGWLGQLAGGSFGTAIEGYTGEQIAKVYGDVRSYITEPETTNDDVIYEVVLLDVFERMGRAITSEALGLEWVKQVPFGWSAEWIALRNLSMGILPPESGSFQNPYSNWIGAQMRGMICGMLAPAWPMEAARLAYLDGVVSHTDNGVYGEMYAAVCTALAFVYADPRVILQEAAKYLPQKSFYYQVVSESLETVKNTPDAASAWKILETRYQEFNWIDAHNNIAAVIHSLWFGKGDMTESFACLAKAGLDVDCNGGLVGNVLGIIRPVPEQWAQPLGDLLETYLKGKERLSIRELAQRTARLARI
jgi:ADP-ribosylglycohydrolase